MKRKDCFMIACRDIKCKRNFCLQAVRGIFTIITVLLFFMLIVYGIHLYYKEETAKCTAYNVAGYTPLRNTADEAFSEEDFSVLKLFSEFSCIESTIDQVNIDMPQLSGMPEKAFVNLKYISVLCGEKTYTQSGDEQEIFSLQATGYNADYQMFSDVQLEAYEILNQTKPLYSGRFPHSANEVLVNEVFLQQFQLKDSDILNQPLSIFANEIAVFSDLTCVGILRNEYTNDVNQPNQAVLRLMLSDSTLAKLPVQTETIRFIPYHPDSYQQIKELILQNNLEDTVVYHSEEVEMCCYIEQIRQFADMILCGIAFLILLALFLSLYSTLLNHVQSSTNYYGTLSAIGMQMRDKLRIFYYEFGCLGVIGVLAAVPVGIALFLTTNVLLNTLFVSELHISALSMLSCTIIVAIVVLILTFLLTAIILYRQFRLQIVTQLKTQF